MRTFGVTPSVFLNVLSSGKYSQESIEQAVRITQRANYNQEIKKNIAGFFLKALKDGFTDPKEEKKKKAAKKQGEIKKKIEQSIAELKNQKTAAVNAVIKSLTQDDPTLTLTAVNELKTSPMTKIVIDAEEIKLGRPLELEDFRQTKMLRDLVKGKIAELRPARFSEVLHKFEVEEKKLRGKL